MPLSKDEVYLINAWREIADSWESRAKYIRACCNQAVEYGNTKGLEEMPEYAFSAGQFNANFGGGGQSLPVGMHPVVIVKTEMKLTKDTTGGMIACTMRAIDGPAKDQTQILNLNVKNNSAEAVRIANEQLAALCAVTGQPGVNMTHTEILHDKPFVVEIAKQKNDDRYVEVVGVYTMDGHSAAEVVAGAGGGGGAAAATKPDPFANVGGGTAGAGAGAGAGGANAGAWGAAGGGGGGGAATGDKPAWGAR